MAARLILAWEQLWPALWPLVGVIGLFLALALFDLLQSLPGWLHAGLLAGFALALLFTAIKAVRALGLPAPEAAQRRLERDSGLAHRPLAALDDRLASGGEDPATRLVWRLHKEQLLGHLSRLRIRPPHPGLAARDPLALRALLLLLLVAAVAMAGEDYRGRLASAFSPRLAAATPAPPPSLDIWINPPGYTAVPPLLLSAAQGTGPGAAEDAPGEAIPVPVGSRVLAQVNGGPVAPLLGLGAEQLAFEAVTRDAWRIEATIEAGDRLTVMQGGDTLGAWQLALLPDEMPVIEFDAPPAETARNTLRLEYAASDDYGLVEVGALIHRLDDPEAAPIELPLTLPGRNLRDARAQSFHDLTPHPWAGIAVSVTLTATDALGQVGKSDPVHSVLPERLFQHPVARALVELRKQLTLDPSARFPVIRALSELYQRPHHFFDDLVVALGIAAAERRLIHDSDPEAVPEVQELLWELALRIEQGELALAERDLRELQEQLMKALAEGADEAEIERLIDELSQALDKFLQALAEQMMEQMAEGGMEEMEQLPPDSRTIDSRELQRMLEKARELARSGARDAAREMLAQLQNMLQNLRANPFSQRLDQNQQDAFDMMSDMDDLMQRQKELLDRSYRRSQEGEQSREGEAGQQGEGKGRAGEDGQMSENQRDAATQEQLRRQLGEMMRRLGEALGDIPRPLGRAEQAMRDARDALGGEQAADAIAPQTRALDQLQQGMQAMAQRFMEMMADSPGRGQGPVGMEAGPGRDPLGRSTGQTGFEALEGVEIPNEGEVRRSREILQELRRRSGDRARPAPELDYIERLLRQF